MSTHHTKKNKGFEGGLRGHFIGLEKKSSHRTRIIIILTEVPQIQENKCRMYSLIFDY